MNTRDHEKIRHTRWKEVFRDYKRNHKIQETGGMVLKKKVLIIDDDLDTCRQIKYALQDVTTDACYALSVAES